MAQNRIRELRKAAGMTISELADRVGLSQGYLSRLEMGERVLQVAVAEKIAMHVGKSAGDVLGLDGGEPPARKAPGFADELVAYMPASGDPLGPLVGVNQYLFEVRSNSCDLAGAPLGMVVAVTDDAKICKAPPPLALVRVRIHPRDNFLKPLTLLRQFVPPRMLVTNSSTENEMPIDMAQEDAHIVGVVISAHRRFQS